MGTLLMSFLKGLFGRCLTATRLLTLKKCGKIDLLKNTKQVYRTCVGNYQFSKLEEKKSHECPETYVEFFFT